jgi:putative hemolysin
MTHRKSVVFLPCASNKLRLRMYVKGYILFIRFIKWIMMILLVLWIWKIFAHIDDENSIVADHDDLIWTQQRIRLERFKNRYPLCLCCRWIWYFQGVITLNDILEALVGDALILIKRKSQLIEREMMEPGWWRTLFVTWLFLLFWLGRINKWLRVTTVRD